MMWSVLSVPALWIVTIWRRKSGEILDLCCGFFACIPPQEWLYSQLVNSFHGREGTAMMCSSLQEKSYSSYFFARMLVR